MKSAIGRNGGWAVACWLAVATIAAPSVRAEQPVRVAAVANAEAAVSAAVLGELLDKLSATVQGHFHDEALLQRIGWTELVAQARPQIVAAGSVAAAAPLINALLGELKTSHTAFYTPDDTSYYILLDVVGATGAREIIDARYWGTGPHFAGIGAFTTKLGQRHFIDAVLEGSPADRAGLKFGNEIVDVDGEPYSEIGAFRGKAGKTVTLRIRHHAETMLDTVTVPVVNISPKRAFSDATLASARVIERGGKRIGYIHVWASTETDAFERALARIDEGAGRRGASGRDGNDAGSARLDALIVDARGKVGGIASVPARYLDILDPAAGRIGMRVVTSRGGARGGAAPVTFRGRSALLIDGRSRSAAEIFALAYKRSGIGPLVGSTTAGAVTAGRGYMLPLDTYLYLAVNGLEFAGERLEGVGVAPDIRIERPLTYADGADPVIEGAIRTLLNPAPAPQPALTR